MAITINVNGVAISYPQTGDPEWGDDATEFAIQVAGALAKIGQSTSPATNNITIPSGNLTVTTGNTDLGGTLDVTGATTLDSTLTVAGTTTLNGNTNLGNANGDTIAVTGILNVDSGTLYVSPTDNRVGINDSSPSEALDVVGNALISGTLGVTGNTTITGDVITSIVKASGSGGLTIDSNGGTDVALFGAGGGSGTTLYGGLNGTTASFSGVIYADDDTTANTPVISFTGDTNTGIGRSAADTIDFITNGNSRFRIEPTGQIKAVYESQVGTDYNTQLDNGYLCRAWVNFNGTGTVAIRASGNISSITDNGTGDYTINFTIAMPDANYALNYSMSPNYGVGGASLFNLYHNSISAIEVAPTVNAARFNTGTDPSTYYDAKYICVGIFR
jgi:hypothetical protein